MLMNQINRLVGLFIILLIYASTHYYIGVNLFQWFNTFITNFNGVAFSIIFCLIALSIFIVFVPFKGTIKRIFSWIGSYWMGFFIYFLLFFVCADILLLIAKMTNLVTSPISSRVQFYFGLSVVLLTFCVVGYGIYNATKIKHVTYTIETTKTKLIRGLKIVLISDLHLGAVNSEKRLEMIVREVNACSPDIICIAGDIFNDDYNTIINEDRAIALFRGLSSTYGVYASLGNHDGGATFSDMVRFLEKCNIQLLNDDYTVIDHKLILWGRLDSSPIGGYGTLKRKSIAHKMAALDHSMPIIVMDHTPNKLDEYSSEVDLIVAGHTHKGQLFPGSLITRLVFEVDYGHYQRNDSSPHVIVSSGVGTWGMPMRVGSHNEIVTITLK